MDEFIYDIAKKRDPQVNESWEDLINYEPVRLEVTIQPQHFNKLAILSNEFHLTVEDTISLLVSNMRLD